jgi:hypothetical protein
LRTGDLIVVGLSGGPIPWLCSTHRRWAVAKVGCGWWRPTWTTACAPSPADDAAFCAGALLALGVTLRSGHGRRGTREPAPRRRCGIEEAARLER